MSGDGSQAFLSYGGGQCSIIDIANGHSIWDSDSLPAGSRPGHPGPEKDRVCYCHRRRVLAVAKDDIIHVVPIDDLSGILKINVASGCISSIAIAPDGASIAVGSQQGVIYQYSTNGEYKGATKQLLGGPIIRLAYSAGGALICASTSESVNLLRSSDLSTIKSFSYTKGQLRFAVLSPNENTVAIVTNPRVGGPLRMNPSTIMLFNLHTFTSVSELVSDQLEIVTSLAFSPCGCRVAAISVSGKLGIWGLAGHLEYVQRIETGPIWADIAFAAEAGNIWIAISPRYGGPTPSIPTTRQQLRCYQLLY